MYSLNIYKIYVNYFFATDPDNRKEKSLHFEFKFVPKNDAFDDIIWKFSFFIYFYFCVCRLCLKSFTRQDLIGTRSSMLRLWTRLLRIMKLRFFVHSSFLWIFFFFKSFCFGWLFVFVIALSSSLGCFLVRLRCTSLKSSVTWRGRV